MLWYLGSPQSRAPFFEIPPRILQQRILNTIEEGPFTMCWKSSLSCTLPYCRMSFCRMFLKPWTLQFGVWNPKVVLNVVQTCRAKSIFKHWAAKWNSFPKPLSQATKSRFVTARNAATSNCTKKRNRSRRIVASKSARFSRVVLVVVEREYDEICEVNLAAAVYVRVWVPPCIARLGVVGQC